MVEEKIPAPSEYWDGNVKKIGWWLKDRQYTTSSAAKVAEDIRDGTEVPSVGVRLFAYCRNG